MVFLCLLVYLFLFGCFAYTAFVFSNAKIMCSFDDMLSVLKIHCLNSCVHFQVNFCIINKSWNCLYIISETFTCFPFVYGSVNSCGSPLCTKQFKWNVSLKEKRKRMLKRKCYITSAVIHKCYNVVKLFVHEENNKRRSFQFSSL